jgi:hypothetical protein
VQIEQGCEAIDGQGVQCDVRVRRDRNDQGACGSGGRTVDCGEEAISCIEYENSRREQTCDEAAHDHPNCKAWGGCQVIVSFDCRIWFVSLDSGALFVRYIGIFRAFSIAQFFIHIFRSCTRNHSSVNGSPLEQFDQGEVFLTAKKRRGVEGNGKVSCVSNSASFPISIGIGVGNGETIDLSDPNQRKNLNREQKAHAMQQLMAIQEQMNKLMADF